jgi:crossover junction endodeoxyribonuclease RusA
MLKSTAPEWCPKKPDPDNLAKAVMDALTDCGMWRDDAQIVVLEVTKRFGQIPGARICIKEVE